MIGINEISSVSRLLKLLLGKVNAMRSDVAAEKARQPVLTLGRAAQQAGMRLGDVLRRAWNAKAPRAEQVGDSRVIPLPVIDVTNDAE